MSAVGSSFKRVLVTGCAGFIGSQLCEQLLGQGVQIVGVDRFSDYYDPWIKHRNIEALVEDPRFELWRCDLGSDRLEGVLEGVDAVFHLAARAGVRGSFGDAFSAYLSDNVLATQRLLEASVGRDLAAFVYASSSSVYGHAADPVTETSPRHAVSAYGATKMATEDLAGLYHRTAGIPVVGMRYFTVYGPRQRPDMAFSRFINRAINHEPITIYGDGSQVRDFTFVGDAIYATLAAAERGRPGAVYNVGAGVPCRVVDAIHVIQELVGTPIQLRFEESVRGDAKGTNCDGTQAWVDLGFRPRCRLLEGLEQQVEWTLAVEALTGGQRLAA